MGSKGGIMSEISRDITPNKQQIPQIKDHKQPHHDVEIVTLKRLNFLRTTLD